MPKATPKAASPTSGRKKLQQHKTRSFYWYGYKTRRWRNLRASYFRKHPNCVQCAAEGIEKDAVVLDHIKPVQDMINKKGYDPWNEKEWQGLCTYHDAQKRGRTKRKQ